MTTIIFTDETTPDPVDDIKAEIDEWSIRHADMLAELSDEVLSQYLAEWLAKKGFRRDPEAK